MKRYIAVLEIEDDEEIIDASVSYSYSYNGMNYKATERMELKEESEDARNKTYEDGLNDAWEAVKRLYNELGLDKQVELFGYCAPHKIVNALTPQEVIEKLEKHDRIEVGDEVTDNDGWKGVVTGVSPDGEYMIVVLQDGSALRWEKKGFKKTGRHFPQIEEVLKQIQ